MTTLILSLALLFYAVPRLSEAWSQSFSGSLFVFSWLVFALLVVAANWRSVLGVDRQESRQLARIERLKRWRREQWVREKLARDPGVRATQSVYRRNA